MRTTITGNHAQSLAAQLARVQVVSAYPITPQTTIVEQIAELVARGEMPAEFLEVESEHSALQACISAAAGRRAVGEARIPREGDVGGACMKPCANSCLGEEDCRRVDCCHNCRLYVRAACANDGTYGFVPR